MSTATISPRQLTTTVVVAASDSEETWRASWDATLARYLQCDGTDDEVEILAAIATVLAAGGGEVVLLEGTYTLGASIAITSSNLTLRGQGRTTIITTAVDALDILTCIGTPGDILTNIILRDFLVRGFETGVMNGIGVSWDYVDDSKIINVWSEHNGKYAFYIFHSDHNEIEGCHGYSNNEHGIYVSTGSWVTLTGCVCNCNVKHGIVVVAATDCKLVAPTCNENDFADADSYDGISALEATRLVVIGAHCSDNDHDGLRLFESSRCSILGGQFNNNGQDGMHIRGDDPNSDYNTVAGIIATGNTANGLEISEVAPGDSNKNSVASCHLLGNTGANFVDGGTGTVTGHNITA